METKNSCTNSCTSSYTPSKDEIIMSTASATALLCWYLYLFNGYTFHNSAFALFAFFAATFAAGLTITIIQPKTAQGYMLRTIAFTIEVVFAFLIIVIFTPPEMITPLSCKTGINFTVGTALLSFISAFNIPAIAGIIIAKKAGKAGHE